MRSRESARGPGHVEIEPVSGGRALREFVRLPWRIYRDDPVWVPPLLGERKAFLDPRQQPFYDYGAAEAFVARQEGEVVGRILVSDSPPFNEVHGTHLGCFGLFESLPDPEVAHALLERAATWLRARGRKTIRGPIDYSLNHPCGLLVRGFETPPRILMNHNPPYYAELLESWGLRKAKDLYAWWLTQANPVPERWRRLTERLARRGNVRIRPIDLRHLDREIQLIREVYNRSWEKNWGFMRLTEREFDHLARDIKRVAIADLLLLAEAEGRPVGFCMSLPDIHESLRKLDGRLLPFGFLTLLRDLRPGRIQAIRMLTLGVVEGYRRRGIAEQFIMQTFDTAVRLGIQGCEVGWTLEDNDLINRPIQRLGADLYKVYRIYERDLA
ncbi:MAG: N-acetyltransferase [Myxococcota bacterium]